MFKKLFSRITTPISDNVTIPNTSGAQATSAIGGYSSAQPWQNIITTGAIGAVMSPTFTGVATNVTAAAPAPYTINSGYANVSLNSAGMIGGSNGMFAQAPPTHIIAFSKPSSQEIVRLNLDGSVTWPNGIEIDEAAEAFGKSLQLGAEMRAGINKSVKLKMRDSVFEDLISIAKEKGSLTAEDLTYLLEASKIVEKLKGGKE
jgi:hypothetical protein